MLHLDGQRRQLAQRQLVAGIELQDPLEVFGGILAIFEADQPIAGPLDQQRDHLVGVGAGAAPVQPVSQHPIQGLGVAGRVGAGAQQVDQALEPHLVVGGVLQHLEVGGDRLLAMPRAFVERRRLREEGGGVSRRLDERAEPDQRARLAQRIATGAREPSHAEHRLETVGVAREDPAVHIEGLAEPAVALLLQRALEVELGRQTDQRCRQLRRSFGARTSGRGLPSGQTAPARRSLMPWASVAFPGAAFQTRRCTTAAVSRPASRDRAAARTSSAPETVDVSAWAPVAIVARSTSAPATCR